LRPEVFSYNSPKVALVQTESRFGAPLQCGPNDHAYGAVDSSPGSNARVLAVYPEPIVLQ
jgi:hypothetical protein